MLQHFGGVVAATCDLGVQGVVGHEVACPGMLAQRSRCLPFMDMVMQRMQVHHGGECMIACITDIRDRIAN